MTTAQLERLPDKLRWFVSPHAVVRFRQRVADWTNDRVRHYLVEQCRGAHFVKALACGLELWRGPKPRRIRLRVSRQGNVLVLESVLFTFDRCAASVGVVDSDHHGEKDQGQQRRRRQGDEEGRR